MENALMLQIDKQEKTENFYIILPIKHGERSLW